MMETLMNGPFLLQWAGIALIVWLAAASPGPDFIIAVRNAVLHSKKAGLYTALGIALGILVHVSYCIVGIAALINQSVLMFSGIKYAGAAYLIFLGIKGLRSRGYGGGRIIGQSENGKRQDINAGKAIRQGFLTNLLNPKATMFFFALFTQIIGPETPVAAQILFGVTASLVAGTWFSIVAVVLNQRTLRQKFLNASGWIDRICGGLLIALGVRLAISRV